MKIIIKERAADLYRASATPVDCHYAEKLKMISGKIIEVDTTYLFRNHFNTVPIPDISLSGMKIDNKYVSDVIGDIRHEHRRCQWCGLPSHIDEFIDFQKCPKCFKSGYMESLT